MCPQASALLSLRPYLKNITKSEFFTITTSCLASIGGAYLAILTQIGVRDLALTT